MQYSDSYHNVFLKGDWNLERIKNYFGDSPQILLHVLERRSCTVDVVKLLLERDLDIDQVYHAALGAALENSNNEAVIRFLLERDTEVKRKFEFKRTPLLKYLKREDSTIGIVKVLLDFEADINLKDVYGDSALTTAIRNSKDDAVIRVLVEAGAEVNDSIKLHNTPLLVLLRRRINCSADTVTLLLEKGADANCVDDHGDSALMTALAQGRDEAVIQVLLENGANVNIVCRNDETPLLLYLRQRYCSHYRAYDKCSIGIVKLLLHYGAEVNSINGSRDSPLVIALKNSRDEKIIRMLLERGANVNSLHGWVQSSLCIAFRHSSNDIVKLLLDAGASPNACTFHRSALHCATDFSHSGLREDILKRLLDANGCEPSVPCFALQHGAKPNDIRLLMHAGVALNTCMRHSSLLICATDHRQSAPLREDVVQLLLDNGASVGDKDLEVIQNALRYCNYETGAIRLLLNLPGMDAYVANRCDESLLHLAVQNPKCKLDAVRLLISRKVQVNSRNQSGETPLHCAVRNRTCDPSVINLLLQNGSHVNARNKSGQTPLVLAVKQECHAYNFKDLLKEFLIAGACIGKEKFYSKYLSEEFELLEFLAREYAICDDPITRDGYRMLVKFFFLLYPECDIRNLQNASVEMNGAIKYCIEEISKFVKDCLKELREMDLLQVGNGRTFREFVAGKPCGVNYELGQVLENISKNVFPVFLDVIFSRFRVYHDVIFARVKKLMVEQKYCPNSLSVGKFKLDCVILSKIATFSSDDDFLRFILASCRPVKVENNSSSFVTGKRSFEPSAKPNKLIKLDL